MNNAYRLSRDFEHCDRFSLASIEDEGSTCYCTGIRIAQDLDFGFSYACEMIDPSRPYCNCIVKLFLNFP